MHAPRTARRPTSGTRVASLLLAALALTGAGCGSDSTSPTSSEAGTYTLVSVNGQAKPVTFMNTALGTVVVQSGTLTLTPGSPSRYTAVIGGTANGQASPALVGDNGTYTVAGANVSFTSGVLAGLTYVGVVSGNSISVAVPAFVIGTTGTLTLVLQKS